MNISMPLRRYHALYLQYIVPLKCNVALVHEQVFARTRIIITNLRGVAPSSLASIHPVYSGVSKMGATPL